MGGRRAVGVDTWDTGEPFLYTTLAGAAEDGCFVHRVDAPSWLTASCDETHRALCETQVWPSWVSP